MIVINSLLDLSRYCCCFGHDPREIGRDLSSFFTENTVQQVSDSKAAAIDGRFKPGAIKNPGTSCALMLVLQDLANEEVYDQWLERVLADPKKDDVRKVLLYLVNKLRMGQNISKEEILAFRLQLKDIGWIEPNIEPWRAFLCRYLPSLFSLPFIDAQKLYISLTVAFGVWDYRQDEVAGLVPVCNSSFFKSIDEAQACTQAVVHAHVDDTLNGRDVVETIDQVARRAAFRPGQQRLLRIRVPLQARFKVKRELDSAYELSQIHVSESFLGLRHTYIYRKVAEQWYCVDEDTREVKESDLPCRNIDRLVYRSM